MATGTRQNSREFDLDTENVGATGVWSDGATIWVADSFANKVFAYALDGGARQDGDDIDLASDNNVGGGIWSDGATIWVSEERDTNPKLFAYVLDGGDRVEGRDFNTLQAAGASLPTGLWSDGETMWVADVTENNAKVYAFNQPPSADNRLSDLTVSPKNIFGFDAGRTSYQVGVASTVTQATITATANHANATVDYSGTDVDAVADGHQMDLSEGRNPVTITVTAEDGTTQDYTVSVNRGVPGGIWCDDTYMWVLDVGGKKIYAYLISSKERQSDQDFNTLEPTENDDPSVIWSDGSTMWVADSIDDKLYAYKMSDKTPDTGKEFNTLFGIVRTPTGLWSDGATMWVSDITDNKLYAYRMSDTQRDEDKDLNTPDAAGNTNPTGIWGKDRTIWVADITADKVYSYNKPLSDDATLSGLTVGPKDIIGFDAERTSYQVGVASTVTQATVIATPNHPAATVDYSGTDADLVTDGHQVDLSDGRNTVTITVTAEDGSNTQDYTVSVNRGVTDDYGWKASDDLDGLIAAGNIRPTGIHANDTTAWVLNTNNPKKIFAYSRSTGARDTTKDFDIDLPNPVGMWSDGPTLWVTEYRSDTGALRAYTLATGTRLPGQDFENLTAAGNISPFGIWSDGTTMWVADSDDRHLYAYDRVNKTRQMDKELTLSAFDWNNNEINPGGFWMDDTTIWVASPIDDDDYITLVRAIKRSDGSRDTSRDIPVVAAGSDRAHGIWADDETMLIVDGTDDKVYSFNLPEAPSTDATLSALTVSPRDIIGFDAERTSYQVGVASTVAEATVAATATDANADVSFDPQDSNDVTDGHQVALSEGRNPVTITVTAEDGTTQDYTVSVNRGVTSDYGWNAEHDLDGLVAAGTAPYHLWTNGTTIWVGGSSNNRKLTAFNTDGSRDSTRDFETLNDAGNDAPVGIWSNGTTMWVADVTDLEIYAYSVSTKAQDTTKKFEGLDTTNSRPSGIWSNDTTMWVADSEADKIFAYNLSTKARDHTKEFDTLDAAGNNIPNGIWSDGETMWVADFQDVKIYAYNMGTKKRDQAKEFNPRMAAGQDMVFGITSNSTTMWVSHVFERKLYAYNMPPPSDDATLSALTVSPKDIIGFDADRASYEVGVASTVTEATVAATTTDSNAEVSFDTPDSNDVTDGHQVALSAGRNEVTITVTAEDDSTEDYTVNINRGVTDDYGWKADDDLDGLIAAGQQQAAGIWSNGTTIWVTDPGNKRLTAYNRDGTRNSSEDFNALAEGQNAQPAGIWSNGTTMWVADGHLGNLFAYNMSDKQRDTTRDIRTFILNPGGVWSDGTTIWVLNAQNATILAFNISSRSLDSAKEFNTLVAASNQTPRGIWSDRTTMWVADAADDKVYAYNMSDKQRDDTKDFNTLNLAGNHDAYGLWSDHTTMWITDQVDRKVYSYNKPLSADNSLSDLTVSPKDITGFDPARTSYEVGVASTVPQATVVARATNGAATVDYSGTDVNLVAPGHQVNLSDGRNTITVTVTAQDNTEKAYTVSINRGVTDDYGWNAERDLDGIETAGNETPIGIWSNSTTIWVVDSDDESAFAYDHDGTRDADKDFDFDSSHQAARGAWSDGEYVWIVDRDDNKLYVYEVATGTRQNSREFDLDTENVGATGVWSDGATIWVADSFANKVFAYALDGGARQDGDDIDLASDNNVGGGIWSDGATIWVSEERDTNPKLFAYVLDGGDRVEGRDFNTLQAAGASLPTGLWSDGETMWVADVTENNSKIYAFNMPPSANANLSSLTVSPKDIIGFAPDRTSYEVGVASTVAEATVAATATDSNADVSFDSQDSNDVTDGHQVTLSAGRNTVTVTVTAEDGSTRAYTVSASTGASGPSTAGRPGTTWTASSPRRTGAPGASGATAQPST